MDGDATFQWIPNISEIVHGHDGLCKVSCEIAGSSTTDVSMSKMDQDTNSCYAVNVNLSPASEF